MIRAFLTALWLCAVTLSGTIAASQLRHGEPAPEPQIVDTGGAQRYVELDLTAIPVISGNQIEGYFLTRMAYVLDESKAPRTDIPIELILNDMYMAYAYNSERVNFGRMKRIDLNEFSSGLMDYLNKRIGEGAVVSNLILQIDYRKIKEVRSATTERL